MRDNTEGEPDPADDVRTSISPVLMWSYFVQFQ